MVTGDAVSGSLIGSGSKNLNFLDVLNNSNKYRCWSVCLSVCVALKIIFKPVDQ